MPDPATQMMEKAVTVVAPATAAVIFMVRWIRSDRSYHDAADFLSERVEQLEERQGELLESNRGLEHRCLEHELKHRRVMAHIDDLEGYLRDLGLDVPPLPETLKPHPPLQDDTE
jgi:hypothetical protein